MRWTWNAHATLPREVKGLLQVALGPLDGAVEPDDLRLLKLTHTGATRGSLRTSRVFQIS